MKKIISVFTLLASLLLLASCFELSGVDVLQVKGDIPEVAIVNEELDLSGIVIEAQLVGETNFTTINLNQATISGNVAKTVGKNICTISYGEASATITYYAYKKASQLTEIAEAADGSYLFFPAGTYKTSDVISVDTDVVVLGEQGTKFEMAANSEGVFSYAAGSTLTYYMFLTGDCSVSFNNIQFVGLKGDLGKSEICMSTVSTDLSILNCVFTNFAKGALVVGNGSKLVFDNNYLNYTAPQTGNRAPNAIQVNENCEATITNNTVNGFFNPSAPLWSSAILMAGTNTSYTITGNTFINCGTSVYVLDELHFGNLTIAYENDGYYVTVGTDKVKVLNKTDYAQASVQGCQVLSVLDNASILVDNTFINSTISDVAIYINK